MEREIEKENVLKFNFNLLYISYGIVFIKMLDTLILTSFSTLTQGF